MSIQSSVMGRGILLVMCLVSLCGLVTPQSRPEVVVAQGKLTGLGVISPITNKKYYSFKGIPYAQPPVGEYRFKAPRPPKPWSGILDAKQEGASCIQPGLNSSEDCLYLNVYTPVNPAGQSTSPKAVMVWVHGGAFTSGNGDSSTYGPDFLVAEDVVVVTMNYRLGILGFLNLNHTVAPGNMGLRDQVAALQWVKENIAKFGGDPNKVTLFGESAGAASVNLIMLSPMAKGLFHRAVCQSGSALANWAFKICLRANVEVLAKVTGCDNSDPPRMVECLNKIPASKLISMKLRTKEQENDLSRLPFVPSLDADFLPQTPLQVVRKGNFSQVPFMAGINDGEGHLFAKAFPIREKNWAGDNFENFVPKDLHLSSGSAESKQVAERMKQLYFNGQDINKNNLEDFINMTTDTEFLLPLRKSLNLQANYSKQPQYLYLMTFNGKVTLKRVVGVPNLKGVCHAEELGYLWYIKQLPYQHQSPPEMETMHRMVTMWTNFAKTGNPTPEETELLPVKWEPYTLFDPAYLIIDKELRVDRNIMKNRMDVWDDIYKNYAHKCSG